MDKVEFRMNLKKKGYKVLEDDSGVPTVICSMEMFKDTIKEVKAFVKELGYDQTFAIKKADSTQLKALSEKDHIDDVPDETDTTEVEASTSNEAQMPTDTQSSTSNSSDDAQNTIKTEENEDMEQKPAEPDVAPDNQTTAGSDLFDMFDESGWLFNDDTL
jgi:hypothetical protein